MAPSAGGIVSELLNRQTVSFVVRVWAEYQAQDPPACFGEVECLTSGEKRHFRRWNEIALFIEQQTVTVLAGDPDQ
jgi:hypothetical protein